MDVFAFVAECQGANKEIIGNEKSLGALLLGIKCGEAIASILDVMYGNAP
jgi:hypothetical protein